MPEEKDRSKGGRPSIPLRDAIYSTVMKVYSLTSARRFSGELAEAHEAGYICQCPHFNSVLNVFDKEETTPILRKMIETSALPLRSVESQFAIDSTGFASTRYTSWCDHKHGGIVRKKATSVKAHFIVGTKTHTIAAVEIEGPTAFYRTIPFDLSATARFYSKAASPRRGDHTRLPAGSCGPWSRNSRSPGSRPSTISRIKGDAIRGTRPEMRKRGSNMQTFLSGWKANAMSRNCQEIVEKLSSA